MQVDLAFGRGTLPVRFPEHAAVTLIRKAPRAKLGPAPGRARRYDSHVSPRFMKDPRAVACVLDGNPLHEEQLVIVRRLGETYALNTVIDEERDLVFASFGETIASQLAAVEFARDWTAVTLPRRFKTVVTSAAGFPLDRTYY